MTNAKGQIKSKFQILDSYKLKSEVLSLTLGENPQENSPPLAGGDEGEGENWFSCPPPPSPSPIKGEERGLG